MSPDLPIFETATYADATHPAVVPAAIATAPAPALLLLMRSILYGLGGALLGAVLYGGFVHLTHINIGYLSIVIAYLVAKAMMLGSGERGGRHYQISAVLLTCFAVALGNALMLYWTFSKNRPIHLSLYNSLMLLRFGFMEPFYEFGHSAAGALLTLFILFIGLRAAWRMTSGLPGAVRHPFSRGF